MKPKSTVLMLLFLKIPYFLRKYSAIEIPLNFHFPMRLPLDNYAAWP